MQIWLLSPTEQWRLLKLFDVVLSRYTLTVTVIPLFLLQFHLISCCICVMCDVVTQLVDVKLSSFSYYFVLRNIVAIVRSDNLSLLMWTVLKMSFHYDNKLFSFTVNTF